MSSNKIETRSISTTDNNEPNTIDIAASNDKLTIDDESLNVMELNNRIKAELMSYCFSFIQDDSDTRQCLQQVWNKYLRFVGDVAMVKWTNDLRRFRQLLLVSTVLIVGCLFRYTSISCENSCPTEISNRHYSMVSSTFSISINGTCLFNILFRNISTYHSLCIAMCTSNARVQQLNIDHLCCHGL
jgi:hypothetical protein